MIVTILIEWQSALRFIGSSAFDITLKNTFSRIEGGVETEARGVRTVDFILTPFGEGVSTLVVTVAVAAVRTGLERC